MPTPPAPGPRSSGGGNAAPHWRPETVRLARFLTGLVALGLATCVGTLAAIAFLPTMFPGWTSTAVSSGSMSPLIAVGDVVLIRETGDVDDLDAPTVVLIDRPDNDPLLHRIERRTSEGYITRGDANTDNDGPPVSPARILGVGRVVVPFVGYPALWVDRRDWGRIALLAWSLTLVLHLSRYGLDSRYDPWTDAPADNRAGHRSSLSYGGPAAAVLILLMPNAAVPIRPAEAAFLGKATFLNNLVKVDTLNAPASLKAVQRCVPSSTAPTLVGQAMKTFAQSAITFPSQTQAGDALVAIASAKNVTSTPAMTGWTKLAGVNEPSLSRAGGLYWRRASAGDAGRTSTELPAAVGVAVSVWRGAGTPESWATGNFTNDATIGVLGTSWSARETVAVTFSIEAAGASLTRMSPFAAESGEDTTSSPALTMETHYLRATSNGSDTTFQAPSNKSGVNFGYAFVLPAGPTRYVDLTWTASSDTYANGYVVEQPTGTTVGTVTGRTTTTYSHAQPATGTLTYAVRTKSPAWTSSSATATLTTTTC